MAKTITRLEATDIDIKEDRLHKTVMTGLVVGAIYLTQRPNADLTPEERKAKSEQYLATAVAEFINCLTIDGYTITKQEEIPSVFRDYTTVEE